MPNGFARRDQNPGDAGWSRGMSAFAMAEDDVPRHPHDSGIGGHIAQHNRAGTDAAVFAYDDRAQNLCAGANYNLVAQCGMAFAGFLAGTAQRHPLEQRNVVTDARSFADHHPHTMVDKKTSANDRAGMDLDSGDPARELRNW